MNTGDNPDSINLDTGINTGDEAGQTKDEEDQVWHWNTIFKAIYRSYLILQI